MGISETFNSQLLQPWKKLPFPSGSQCLCWEIEKGENDGVWWPLHVWRSDIVNMCPWHNVSLGREDLGTSGYKAGQQAPRELRTEAALVSWVLRDHFWEKLGFKPSRVIGRFKIFKYTSLCFKGDWNDLHLLSKRSLFDEEWELDLPVSTRINFGIQLEIRLREMTVISSLLGFMTSSAMNSGLGLKCPGKNSFLLSGPQVQLDDYVYLRVQVPLLSNTR